MDPQQGQSVAHVTGSYRSDADHAQIVEIGLEGVYGIVTKRKQFTELKFHFRGGKMLKQ